MTQTNLNFGEDLVFIVDQIASDRRLSKAECKRLLSLFKDSSIAPNIIEVSLSDFEAESSNHYKWPAAGFACGDSAAEWHFGDGPSQPVESTMWDIVEKGEVDSRYFLSPNAAKGMMRRADKMGRNLFSALREALEQLAEGEEQ